MQIIMSADMGQVGAVTFPHDPISFPACRYIFHPKLFIGTHTIFAGYGYMSWQHLRIRGYVTFTNATDPFVCTGTTVPG